MRGARSLILDDWAVHTLQILALECDVKEISLQLAWRAASN